MRRSTGQRRAASMSHRLVRFVLIAVFVSVLFAAISAWQTAAPDELTQTPLPDDAQLSKQQATDRPLLATIEMENGDRIIVHLRPDIAPLTVDNFVELANQEFYDGTVFHRVIKDFMIQAGVPRDDVTAADSITGEFAANGFNNPLSHERAVISMARTSADMNSASSQFFIMQRDTPALDGDYAAFGQVISGMEVVDRIAESETDERDKPIDDQIIKSIRITEE